MFLDIPFLDFLGRHSRNRTSIRDDQSTLLFYLLKLSVTSETSILRMIHQRQSITCEFAGEANERTDTLSGSLLYTSGAQWGVPILQGLL